MWVWIVTVETVGDGSNNWGGPDVPGVSVFTSRASMRARLAAFLEGKDVDVEVEEVIRGGGWYFEETETVLRIRRRQTNPTGLDWGLPGYARDELTPLSSFTLAHENENDEEICQEI